MEKSPFSRRKFLQTAALGTAALGLPTFIPSRAFGANDRLRVAVIGLNGRGKDHISGFSKLENVEVATLCDVDDVVLQKTASDFETKSKRKVKTESDLRKVYEDKDIDAVSIATPNHWHALAAIWACQSGKDVYVEKPGCHNLYEGRKLVEAANKYGRIVQHGVQLRSSVAIQEAIQHLRDGLIGKVYMARGTVYKWRADIGNQGIHETDLCMWGLDVGLPEVITSAGGKFLWNDCKETPEVLTSTYHYPKQGKIIEFEVRPWMTNKEDGVEVGNMFYGDKGYMVINGYSDYKTYLGRNREPGPARNAGGDHYKNFADAARARDKKMLNGPVETAHLASSLAHLGNIAYRLGRTLNFDPQKEVFVGDKQANAMLSRKYRAPYLIPTTV